MVKREAPQTDQRCSLWLFILGNAVSGAHKMLRIWGRVFRLVKTSTPAKITFPSWLGLCFLRQAFFECCHKSKAAALRCHSRPQCVYNIGYIPVAQYQSCSKVESLMNNWIQAWVTPQIVQLIVKYYISRLICDFYTIKQANHKIKQQGPETSLYRLEYQTDLRMRTFLTK